MRGKIDHTDYYKQLGEKLRKIREEKNLIQKDVALQLGVTFQQYQKYEKGENRIPAKSLVIFCELTNTEIKALTGSTVGDYEKRYKDSVINYNTNNNITNVYNYNGFFSNFLNLDLNLMKNKIVITTLMVNIIIYFIFNILNLFPDINKEYNHAFLSNKLLLAYITLSIIMFVVFGYSLLTYIITFISYLGLLSTVLRYIFPVEVYLSLGNSSNAINYALAFLLTFLTFYILKKNNINLNSRK